MGSDIKLAEKKVYLSLLRVISCLGIIIMHTNSVFWSRPHGMLWVSANFLETFFYFAVPVFFMISGATLLDYRQRYSTKTFFKKRFSKTLVPFLFWSIVAGLFVAHIYSQEFDFDIKHIISNVLNSQYEGSYWFFTYLFAIYLSIPLLSAVQNKMVVYTETVLIGIVTIGILPLLFTLLELGNWPIEPPVVGGVFSTLYLAIFSVGEHLRKNKDF